MNNEIGEAIADSLRYIFYILSVIAGILFVGVLT